MDSRTRPVPILHPASRPTNAPLAPPLLPPVPPPPSPPPPPPLAAVDRLVLAIHEATRPGSLERRDPHAIGDRLRRASVGAADLLSRLDPEHPEGGARTIRLGELAEARSRLAEVAYYVDLGERLGLLDACEALELFELGLAASVNLAGRLDRLIYARGEEGPNCAPEGFDAGVAMRVEIVSFGREVESC